MKFGALPRNGLILLMLAIFWVVYQNARISQRTYEPLNPSASVLTESSDKEVEPSSESPAVPSNDTVHSFDEKLVEWMSLVRDNTFEMHPREMPAYWRLLGMAKEDTFDAMNERARKDFVFNDFYRHADENRGAMASLNLNVRRVQKYRAQEGNSANIDELYEIWGWTDQSQAWVYVFVTPELPKGISEGEHVQFKVRFAGYFFKLQAYQPALGKTSDRPLVAPLLIGRFEHLKVKEVIEKPVDVTQSILLLVVGAVFVVSLFTFFNKRHWRKSRNSTNEVQAQGTDQDVDWLEQNLDADKLSERSPNQLDT